jgi:hypothetical protein
MQDFNSEIWFNASFAAEVAAHESAPDGPQLVRITWTPAGLLELLHREIRNHDAAYAAAAALLEADDAPFRAVR